MHFSTIITSRLPPAGALLEVPFLRSWPSVGVFRVCSPAPRPGMSLSLKSIPAANKGACSPDNCDVLIQSRVCPLPSVERPGPSQVQPRPWTTERRECFAHLFLSAQIQRMIQRRRSEMAYRYVMAWVGYIRTHRPSRPSDPVLKRAGHIACTPQPPRVSILFAFRSVVSQSRFCAR